MSISMNCFVSSRDEVSLFTVLLCKLKKMRDGIITSTPRTQCLNSLSLEQRGLWILSAASVWSLELWGLRPSESSFTKWPRYK